MRYLFCKCGTGLAGRRHGFVAALSLALIATAGIARAASPAGAPQATAPQAAAPSFALEGFRSAKFGMTEAQVHAAIEKDFHVKSDQVKAETHPVEKTRILGVTVPDLLNPGDKAEVTYTFGFKSHNLIQVGVVWSSKVDPNITPQALAADADLLRTHFLAAGYKPDTIVQNGALSDGDLLVFRGADAAGHTTALTLSGELKDGKDGKKQLTPNTLMLRYIEDPKHPDTFSVPDGQF